MQEIAYAAYLGIPALILPTPQNTKFISCYARSVNAALTSGIGGSSMHLTVCIKISKSMCYCNCELLRIKHSHQM